MVDTEAPLNHRLLACASIGIAVIGTLSCSSGDSTTPPVVTTLAPTATVIDSTQLRIQSTAAELANGTYRYAYTGTAPSIVAGSVIVGAGNGGYLRLVRQVTQSGGTLTLQTDPASLTDVVQDGELHFSGTGSPSLSMAGPGTGVQWGAFRASSAIPGVTITNGRIDLKNVVVFGTAASGLSVQNGSITFSPNVKLDLSIGFFTVKEFQVSVGGSLTFDADLVLGVRGAFSPFSDPIVIGQSEQPFVAAIGSWPVYGRLITTYSLRPELSASGQATVQTGLTASAGVNLGAKYTSGTWQSLTGPTGSFTIKPLTATVGGGAVAKLGVRVESQLLLYETIGPYLWAEPYIRANAAVNLLQNSWSTSCTSALNAGVGISVKIFSHVLADFNTDADFLSANWPICAHVGTLTLPGSMAITSGDRQTATAGTRLVSPLIVQVLSPAGAPVTGVAVLFSTTGGGVFQPATAVTDAQGRAQTSWILGSTPGTQAATATAAGYLNSPLGFSAIAANTASCPAVPYTLGTVVSGTLVSTDCTFYFGNQNTVGVADAYLVNLATPQVLQVTMNAAFGPNISVNIEPSSYYNNGFNATSGQTSVTFKAIVPGGPLYIRPNNGGPGVTGSYNFTVFTVSGDVTNCEPVVLAANVSASQRLSSTDCAVTGGYADRYSVAIPPRWTATATMRSAVVDSYLYLTNYAGGYLTGDDDSAGGRDARITYTNPSSTDFLAYWLYARSFTSNATGPYTIQLTLTPPAGLHTSPGSVQQPMGPVTGPRP